MEELIKRAKNGDKEAFNELATLYQQDLYKATISQLNNEEDRNDAIQEAMISAYKNLKRLKDTTNFKAWMIKIVINKCTDIHRKRKFKFVPLENVQDVAIYSEDSKIYEELDFNKIMSFLNDKEKTAAILYYSNGYTTKQISKILNTNENTIKTRLRRIRNKLKEVMDKNKEEVD